VGPGNAASEMLGTTDMDSTCRALGLCWFGAEQTQPDEPFGLVTITNVAVSNIPTHPLRLRPALEVMRLGGRVTGPQSSRSRQYSKLAIVETDALVLPAVELRCERNWACTTSLGKRIGWRFGRFWWYSKKSNSR
jgi:hypothetical protein